MSIAHPGFGLARQPTAKELGSIRVYPFVRWEQLHERIVWRVGEHVLCVGGTGSGKTTLMAIMLRKMPYVVVYVSKGADPTLTGPLFRNFVVYRTWPPKKKDHKVLLWPKNGTTVKETRDRKREILGDAINDVLLHRGQWCEAFDELHYMSDSLRLADEITDSEEQGRSAGISLWGNTQRPASIPLACYANASHGFFFLAQEEYDVKRLGQIRNRYTNPKELIYNIERLDKHEFVYIDRYGKIPPCRSLVER